jgi:hypothetical protein
MDTNDFLGSVAQEDVQFSTRVVKTSQVGDNFWKAMVFVESDRFVDASGPEWTPVPGSLSIKALTVTANDYAEHTSGVLRSWLYDLFCNGFTGDCILVACAPHSTGTTVIVYSSDGVSFFEDQAMSIPATIPAGKTPQPTGETNQYSYQTDPSSEEFIAKQEEAYKLVKAYAYHKTVCACPTLPLDVAFSIDTTVATALADLCAYDKGLLSSAPYYPFTTGTPEDAMSDPLYAALKNADKDAFMSAHQDKTRNGALYSLGLAMSTLNGSGTSVGNSMDMIKSAAITSSGAEGANLDKSIRDVLYNLHVQTFKPLGDNSGNVVAKGAETLKGEVVQAVWIVAYVTYMVKIEVARLMTVPNFLKNQDNYNRILGVMMSQLAKFGSNGSNRLRSLASTAPSFDQVPAAKGDQIIIPDAWSARYVDQVRNVDITGTLYIGEGE